MFRSNAIRVEVNNPTLGLFTRIPSNSPDRKGGRALTVARNVRAERGVLMNAPGYEKVIPSPGNLDSPANLIYQSEIINVSPDVRNTPIIGTGGKVYTIHRRAQPLICDLGVCRLTAAFVGDTQANSNGLSQVRDLIASWSPGVVCHLGDLVYGGYGTNAVVYNLEETIGQFYHRWIGGYSGFYGTGPYFNNFFPTLGNHDWSDEPIAEYHDFFNLPGNERYYTFKRGPVQFFVFSGEEGSEPDGISAGSVQGQWLQAAVAASDCPWRLIVVHKPSACSDLGHYPGDAALDWLRSVSGVTAVMCGHAHNMEVIKTEGKAPIFICGTGGASLREFHDPAHVDSVWRLSGQYGAMRLDANTETLTIKHITVDAVEQHVETFDAPSASSGVCYIADAARRPVALAVRPSHATVEVGYSWQYEAWVTTEDGNVLDVTANSSWSVADTVIAAIGSSTGRATGRRGGSTTVTAEYAGLAATAVLDVKVSCLDSPLDLVLVIERSDSSGTAAGGVSNRLQEMKEAGQVLLDSLSGEDQVGLVSFAGTFTSQAEDATLDSVLTTDYARVGDRLSLLIPSGGRSLAEAISVTRAELNSSRARSGADQLAVLVVNGAGNIVNPGGDASSESAAQAAAMAAASTQATLLREDGVLLVVVGYGVPEGEVTGLRALASAGYYFGVDDPDELKSVLGGLAHLFCLYDGYYYYTDPANDQYSPQLDYFGFLNWDVVDGVVDLCGRGSNGLALYDAVPNGGLYVDLVGTDPSNAHGAMTSLGTMRTKAAFPLVAGRTYRVSVQLAGSNRRIAKPGQEVRVFIDGLLDETVVIDDTTQPWTEYAWEVTPAVGMSRKLTIQQLSLPYGNTSTVGTFLDEVKIASGEDVVFYDNFDNENPVD